MNSSDKDSSLWHPPTIIAVNSFIIEALGVLGDFPEFNDACNNPIIKVR